MDYYTLIYGLWWSTDNVTMIAQLRHIVCVHAHIFYGKIKTFCFEANQIIWLLNMHVCALAMRDIIWNIYIFRVIIL